MSKLYLTMSMNMSMSHSSFLSPSDLFKIFESDEITTGTVLEHKCKYGQKVIISEATVENLTSKNLMLEVFCRLLLTILDEREPLFSGPGNT